MKTRFSYLKKSLPAWLLLLTACISFPAVSEAKNVVKNREFNKSFAVPADGSFKADNRYGSITVSYHESNEVIVDVKIEVKASSESDATDALNRIVVDIERKGSQVSAVTSIKNTINDGSKKLKIDYYVTLPSTLRADLAQKYGSLTMPEENRGIYQISVKYGSLEAGNFIRPLIIDAAYSSLKTGSMTDLTLNAAYCNNIAIKDIQSAVLDLKYSDISVDHIDRLTLSEKYGNIKIGYLASDLIVKSFSYSNMIIDRVNENFAEISLTAKYSNVRMNISKAASFSVWAAGIKYGSCRISDSFNLTRSQQTDKGSFLSAEINGGKQGKINVDGGGYSDFKIGEL